MRRADETAGQSSAVRVDLSGSTKEVDSMDRVLAWAEVAAKGPLTPFFETDANPNATRRLLLVFFYFAPSAEVGALRWLSMSQFAAERGWAIDVVTLHPEFMETIDPARLSQLPRGIRLFGFSGENPLWYRTLLATWRLVSRGAAQVQAGDGASQRSAPHQGNGAHPTSRSDSSLQRSFRSRVHLAVFDGLARRASALGQALARHQRYDAVLSSGPPHAAHESARRIASAAGVPFVMDMRDPWSDESAVPEEFESAVWRRETAARERACVSSADLVVVTSRAHEELQVAKYPMLRTRIATVMNGADSDPLPARSVSDRFVIAFTGMIYLGRNPRPLFRAIANVLESTGATPDELAVEFMGDDSCDGVPLESIAADEGIGAHFTAHGFRPRNEALELLARASLLVSLPLRTEMTLPAKLFEYTRFDAWLLALAGPNSATAKLLAGTMADVVDAEDVARMSEVIGQRYAEFRAGVRPAALNRDGAFDRAKQAARLFDALGALAAASGAAR